MIVNEVMVWRMIGWGGWVHCLVELFVGSWELGVGSCLLEMELLGGGDGGELGREGTGKGGLACGGMWWHVYLWLYVWGQCVCVIL